MNTFDFDMSEFVEMCKAFGVSVKAGSGNVTLAGKQFSAKEVFENTLPASVTPTSYFSSFNNTVSCRIDMPKGMIDNKSFPADKTILLVA